MEYPSGVRLPAPQVPPRWSPARRRSVLIAEPSLGLNRLLKATLGDDFEYLDANTGEELLAALHRGSPDLVLLDVSLPGPDVLGLCAALRERSSFDDTRILLLSTTPVGDGLSAVAGIDATLTKPFRPLELLDTVYRLLGTDDELLFARL